VTEFDKVIHPGGVGKVSAAVHTTNFKGPVTKSVTVTTNDPENSRFTLTIKAVVTVPLDVQPSENIAFNGKAESLSAQQVTITSADGQPFDITSVTAADPSFTATVVAVPAEGSPAPATKAGTVASGVGKYRVTVNPSKNIAVGRLNSSILLKTTHPKASDLTLRVFGTVTGDIDVVPQYLTLSTGASATSEAKVQHAMIKKPTGEPLQILSVTSDNPQVETKLTTVTEGREYDLEVRYTGAPATTALSAKIAIATNDTKQPKLEVQVWGRVDPGMRPPQASAAPVVIKPTQAQAPTP
jgi:hypothetical protein